MPSSYHATGTCTEECQGQNEYGSRQTHQYRYQPVFAGISMVSYTEWHAATHTIVYRAGIYHGVFTIGNATLP